MLKSSLVWSQGEILSEEDVKFPEATQWEFGATAGTMLPFGIEGVRDKYPWWGAYISHPGRVFSSFEYQFFHSRAKDVTFYQTSISGKVDFLAYDYVEGFFKLGIDLNYYNRKRTRLRTFEFVSIIGGHVGFGAYVPVTDSFKVRSEFKYNFNPGSFLYVGIGFAFLFGGGEGSEQDEN